MANIALVTKDKTNVAATNTKAAIEGMGHTVTSFNMSEVTASNLLSFNLIVMPRALTDDASYATMKMYIAAYLNSSGIPVLVGLFVPTTGGTVTTGWLADLKLADKATNVGSGSSSPTTVRASSPHAVWSAVSVTPPADYSVVTATDNVDTVAPGDPYVGSAIAVVSSTDNKITMLMAERGSIDRSGGSFGAKIAFIGWLYGRIGYSANGLALLDAVIDWALAPPAQIIGSVKDEADAPLARIVRAYVRATGAYAGSATSSAVDGTFTIDVASSAELHYVVALDDLSGEKNALVKDRVMPYVA
ncbi:hypothetical protein [Stenotrophomonas pigmentata]|uniref:hypothetical protein n=1 Tax=Stenotrophomonas pigmentata TaxID=3055080 RepID=UPI0026EA35E4|nr:hypothetical protein [Stenotrophomonas sp. 610A2]